MTDIKEVRCSACHGVAPITEADHNKGKITCPYCGASIFVPYVPLFVYENNDVNAHVTHSENKWRIELSHLNRSRRQTVAIDIETQFINNHRIRVITCNDSYTKTSRDHIYVYRADKNAGENLLVGVSPGDNREIQIPVRNDTQERWLCNALRYILNEFSEAEDCKTQRCKNCGATLQHSSHVSDIINCPFCNAGFVTHAASDQMTKINLPHLTRLKRPLPNEVTASNESGAHRWEIRPRSYYWLFLGLFLSVFRLSVSLQLFLIAVVAMWPIEWGVRFLFLLIQVPVVMIVVGGHATKAFRQFFKIHRYKWHLSISTDDISFESRYRGRIEESGRINLAQLQRFYFSKNNTPFWHLFAQSPIEEI